VNAVALNASLCCERGSANGCALASPAARNASAATAALETLIMFSALTLISF
jgi:hypothetical protein